MTDAIVKNLSFGDEAKKKIFEGIDKLTKAVSSTLGASGKRVILEDEQGNPIITKDGVTVAEAIILLDSVENIGAKLIKEAAKKTVKEAGDGTTTATVLAYSILQNAGNELSNLGPRKIKEGIDSAVEKVIYYLEQNSVKVTGEMIDQVASISTNNDIKLGKIIGDAYRSVDETGVVIMETTENSETTCELIDGIQYNKGLTNSNFITRKDTRVAELDNALVLIVESPIENIRKIQPVLEFVIKNNKSLLIIADIEPKVISTLAMNKMKGNIKINIINAPTYGVSKKDTLTDLALLTKAKIINEDLGDDMDLIQPEFLGSCLKSITDEKDTILQVGEPNQAVLDVIKTVKEELANKPNPAHLIRLEKRLARLSAKIAIVKVGANSDIELKEKSDRIEDAICATKAAIKEGIVPGGGIALLNAGQNIKTDNDGEKVLLKAIESPFRAILDNAGILCPQDSLPELLGKVKGKGLNVITGEVVDMIKEGIIDPLLVTKSALINAVSVATTILSTDCVINNLRIDESNRK